jgi:hypothetical protein
MTTPNEKFSNDYEIIEPGDDFGGKSGEAFSHPQLIMTSFRKVIDAGSVEMKEGYWNTKFDRMGNAHSIWVPDARRMFIECVNTLRMILERDIDDKAEKELKIVDDELKKKYENFCSLEENDWKTAPTFLKDKWKKEGSYLRRGMLSHSLPYVFEYIQEEVRTAREVVKALSKLIKRLYDYEEVSYSV